jgi:PCFT/HCP family folate transporter-like MFS transporter 1/3
MLNSVIVLIVQYTNPNGIGLYLIGGVISGLAGGLSVFNLSCYSYVADISSHGDRTSKIGWLESMTYFGATISSLVGGVWIMNEGIGSVYLGIIGCLVSVIFYVILFLPPSVSHQSDLPTINQGEDHHPFYSVVTVAIVRKLCRFMKLVFSSWRIVILLFSFFILEINFLGITDLVVLYSITRLCWSSDVIGYFLASKNLFNGLGALIILPVLSFLKFNDVTILVLGLTSGSIALIIMGVADHSWVMALAVVIGCMRGSAVPIIRSMLSKLSPPNQQGVMFSGLSIIEAFCMLAASSLYNALYPVTYPVYPGLCFFMMSLCVALLIPLICLLYTKHPTNIEHEHDDDDESKNLLAS